MTLPKVICDDLILTSGKHKGKEVEWIVRNDPGYLLWVEEVGLSKLDSSVKELIDAWKANPANKKAASATIWSAKKFREEKGIKKPADVEVTASSTPEYISAPPAVNPMDNAMWGCW